MKLEHSSTVTVFLCNRRTASGPINTSLDLSITSNQLYTLALFLAVSPSKPPHWHFLALSPNKSSHWHSSQLKSLQASLHIGTIPNSVSPGKPAHHSHYNHLCGQETLISLTTSSVNILFLSSITQFNTDNMINKISFRKHVTFPYNKRWHLRNTLVPIKCQFSLRKQLP